MLFAWLRFYKFEGCRNDDSTRAFSLRWWFWQWKDLVKPSNLLDTSPYTVSPLPCSQHLQNASWINFFLKSRIVGTDSSHIQLVKQWNAEGPEASPVGPLFTFWDHVITPTFKDYCLNSISAIKHHRSICFGWFPSNLELRAGNYQTASSTWKNAAGGVSGGVEVGGVAVRSFWESSETGCEHQLALNTLLFWIIQLLPRCWI